MNEINEINVPYIYNIIPVGGANFLVIMCD